MGNQIPAQIKSKYLPVQIRFLWSNLIYNNGLNLQVQIES